MGALAIFGISNDGLNLAVKLLLLFLIAIWAALVFWTYADARRRIEDPMLIGCAAAASLFFPFVGTIVYMIVRPPEYLDDVRERELEIAAASARLHAGAGHGLPVLRLRDREDVPALPVLPAAAEGAVRHLRPAARPALEDLPVLRGRGRPGRAAAAPPRGTPFDTGRTTPRRPRTSERPSERPSGTRPYATSRAPQQTVARAQTPRAACRPRPRRRPPSS